MFTRLSRAHHGNRAGIGGKQSSSDEQKWGTVIDLVKIQRIIVVQDSDQTDPLKPKSAD